MLATRLAICDMGRKVAQYRTARLISYNVNVKNIQKDILKPLFYPLYTFLYITPRVIQRLARLLECGLNKLHKNHEGT
jgi:hypothetical protein